MHVGLSRGLSRAMIAIFAVALFAAPAAASAKKQPTLVGVWQVDVTFTKNAPPQGSHETVIQAFFPGGIFAQVVGGSSTGFGSWKVGKTPRSIMLQFREVFISSTGVLEGWIEGRQKGTISANGKTFVSHGTGQLHSANGDASGPAAETTLKGTRIS
jgi:hypothetical protein